MKNFVEVERVENEKIVKWLRDAVPLGEHPHPYNEFVTVRLANIVAAADAIEAFVDDTDWIEKGLAEWRSKALENARHAEMARATARVAINHLQSVLNKSRTHAQQQDADTSARDWLLSIGSEP
jgi:hypothetical protein